MGLVMSMSCAGSFIIFVYMLSKPLSKKIFSAKWRYRVLTMALFFYLVPIQIGKFFYVSMLSTILEKQNESKIFNISNNIIQIKSTGEFYFPMAPIQTIFLSVWGAVAVITICFGLIIYFKQRKQVISVSENVLDRNLLCSIEILKKQMRIKRKIFYRISYNSKEPLTIGIFRPIILLPNQNHNKEKNNLIYMHELLHIKNHDTLLKILGFFAIGLNWYNPFAYFLFYELNVLSEIVCDETIALSIEREKRICYANLILEMVTGKQMTFPLFVASFSNNKKRVKERILLMMNVKKRKWRLKILSGCLLVMLGITSSLTVLAYEQPTIITVNNSEGIIINKNAEQRDTIFVAEDVDKTDIEKCDSSLSPFVTATDTKLPAKRYFQDENGNIYEIDKRVAQRGCVHNYKNGTYSDHIKSGNGCSIYVYKAQRCNKCGNVVQGDLDHRTDYVKCPH